MSRTPRAVALTAAAVLTLLAGGTAAAAWTVPTAGSAAARTATLAAPSNLTVTGQSCTPTASPAGPVAWRGGAAATGTTTVTGARPAGTQPGDVILAAYATPAESAPITPPAGWTQLRYDVFPTKAITAAVYFHVATAGDPASWAWTTSATVETSSVQMLAYSGVDPSSPLDVSAAATQTSTLVVAPSVTTTVADTRLLALYATRTSSAWSAGDPQLTTRLYGSAVGSSSAVSVTYGSGDQAWPAAGATGNRTATSSASSDAIGQLLALRPVTTPATGVVLYQGGTSSTGTSTVTLTNPAGVVAGDVLVVGIGKRRTTGTISPPAGWNHVRTEQISASYQQAAYWRRATAADVAGTTYAFTTGSTDNALGVLAAYRGVDTVTAVPTSSGQAFTGVTALAAPSVTTTKPDARLVGLFGAQGGRTATTPAGMTFRQTAALTDTPPADGVTIYLHDEPAPSAGATGTRTATLNASANGVAQLVALKAESYPLAAITWTGSGSAFTDGYRLGRSVGGTEVAVTSLAAGSTSHTVGSTNLLTAGTAYTLQLRARASAWLSGATSTSFTAISTC